MKYFIGSPNGSGIEAETFEDFVEYLRDMAMTAEKQGDEWFDVNVENYLEDDNDEYEEIEFFGSDEGDLDAEYYVKENDIEDYEIEWDDYRKGYSLRVPKED